MEPNFRVGQYVLERPLGIGGMAEVWLARNAYLGTPAAVKFLNQAYAGMSEIEQRFLNEGKRQGALNHPNIIKVFGFEYVDNRSFLILQYIDGESLDTILHRAGRLETSEAMRIAISVLNALDYAHDHNIVHRDIKPSNILLDENRIPYLGDFGIVLATNEKRITRAGTAMGTALYMSPEQITDPGSVDRRADIYSMGCVIYEMLTGQPPFNPPSSGSGDTDFAVKMAHVQQLPPSMRQRNPALSPELDAAVMRCLAKNPAERYRTCREVRDALSAAMVARGSTPLPVAPMQPPVTVPSMTPVHPMQAAAPMYAQAPMPHPHAVAAMPPPTPPQVSYGPPPPTSKNKWPMIAGIIAVVAVIAIALVIFLKSRTPAETDEQRQERLKQEALKVQQQKDDQAKKDQDAKDDQAKKDKAQKDAQEAQEATQAAALEKEFVATQERLRAGLDNRYHTVEIHNNCSKSDFDVASTYKDLQGNWVVHGWWNVQSMQTKQTNIYSLSGVMYFYGYSTKLGWNAGDQAITAQVVDNAFEHKINEAPLGKNKQTVKMAKQDYGSAFVKHVFTITCGN